VVRSREGWRQKTGALKAKRPGQDRDALFYESEYTNLENNVKSNLAFRERFFYFGIFNQIPGPQTLEAFSMLEKRKDCTCLCHKRGATVLHVVPCCDGTPTLLRRKKKAADKPPKATVSQKQLR